MRTGICPHKTAWDGYDNWHVRLVTAFKKQKGLEGVSWDGTCKRPASVFKLRDSTSRYLYRIICDWLSFTENLASFGCFLGYEFTTKTITIYGKSFDFEKSNVFLKVPSSP